MKTELSEKNVLLDAIVSALKNVRGIVAIVLGGSHAAGLANEKSDLDIGLYYSEKSPFDIEKVRSIVSSFSVTGMPPVSDFYEWGPWVNGGAWIMTAVGKVDLLYRNIEQVQQTITDAVNGIWHHSFDQQPPFGFRSIIYLAETQVCKPLFDPQHILQSFKSQITPYPVKLRQVIISDSLWLAEFTLMQCVAFASIGDTYNTVGCFTRIVNYLVHALFAINETYPLGDKRALQIIATFSMSPFKIEEKLTRILGHAGTQTDELIENANLLKELWQQVVTLTDGQYEPRFKVSFD
jgi:predicted nucleotidyltransferase